jgi:hypothetical protein
MKKNHSTFLVPGFLFISLFLFTTCAKEYSYEGGPVNSSGSASGTAAYTLTGAGGTCTGSVVAGNYYAGTALSSANTVTLQVLVTAIGTYTINTNNTNGFQFSVSGSFTTTGPQSITLTGSGTPLGPGSSNFTTPVGPGCTFTITIKDAQPLMASYFFPGTPNSCMDAKLNGTAIAQKALDGTNTITMLVDVTSPGAYSITTDTIENFTFNATGTFADTGIHVVSLQGGGVPEKAQNLLFKVSGSNSNCTIPVTVNAPGIAATYVLESDFDQSCATYKTAGTATINQPLTSANTVTLKVFVTVPGSYTISTKTLNGMIFYVTGVFTATGYQYPVLTGTGTPLTQGATLFTQYHRAPFNRR